MFRDSCRAKHRALSRSCNPNGVSIEAEFEINLRTPCVSVTAGDGSIIKQFKANFEYIQSFSKVILAFDNDESGQRYVEEAARLLSPGKAFIAKFPRDVKDASDLL